MLFLIPWLLMFSLVDDQVHTVNGPLPLTAMGKTLIHEHILVDFIGADKIDPKRWDRSAVVNKAVPFIRAAQLMGIRTIFDCTPAYLGRDPLLLKALADSTGIHILTNTGLYGASDNKYLPAYAFTETAEELSNRWIEEWDHGIEGTGIRPGFIKIGVNDGPLSPLHRKLVEAAGITHLATGLTICSHTGRAIAAFDEIKVLQKAGVDPSAFVWVHAQSEPDIAQLLKAARTGAWVSLDGISSNNIREYIPKLYTLKAGGVLSHVLISHDAGWYKPGEPDGGEFNGFTNICQELLPALTNNGFTQSELDTLLIINPATAFQPSIRSIK